MKTILVLSILVCSIALPALGELTDADLDKIRLIVKEEVKTEIAASEKRTREYIDVKVEGLNQRIDDVNKNLNDEIDNVNKNFDRVWLLIIALIGLITAAIAIPQLVIAYREKGQKEMQTQIDQLRKELEAMQQ